MSNAVRDVGRPVRSREASPSPDSPAEPVLRLRQLYTSRATDGLARMVSTYAIPLLVLVSTKSPTLTGLAFLLEWVPRLAMFGTAGTLVDRFGGRRIFRTANAARLLLTGAAAVVLALLPHGGPVTTTVVMVLGTTCGVLSEASFVAVETIGAGPIRALGDAGHRLQAALTTIDQGTMLVGPLLGGLLLIGGSAPMLVSVATLSLVAALTAGWLPAERSTDDGERVNVATGWRTLRSVPALGWLIVGVTGANLGISLLQASSPITVIHQFHDSTAAVGIVWSAAAVTSMVAITLTRRVIDRHGLWAVGAGASVVSTVSITAVALAPNLAAYTTAVAVVWVGEGILTVVFRTLRVQLIPKRAYGSTLSVTIVIILLPNPIAGALVAAVPAHDLPRLTLVCGVLGGVLLFATFARLRTLLAARDGGPSTPLPRPRRGRHARPRGGRRPLRLARPVTRHRPVVEHDMCTPLTPVRRTG